MTFCYLSDSTIPSQKANSIQVMQMCDAVSKIANDVTLYCRSADTRIEDLHGFYGVGTGFQIRRVSLPSVRIIDRFCYAYIVLSSLRSKPRPRTIYARELFVAGLACFLFAPTDNQVVLEVHSPPPNRFWRWWIGRMVASGRLAAVVTISAALANEYLSMYADLCPTRVLVAHDGAPALPSSGIKIARPHHFFASSERPKIGYVGSLRPGKGMELIQRLAPLLPYADFHVVGGDDDVIRSWKASADIPNLIFHGFVDPSKTAEYIAQFDILLAPFQPSVFVGNGNIDIGPWMSPLKIFEYMRMGKPIVASDLSVLKEVLEHGRNALLAEATSPTDWAEKISHLLSNADLKATLGTNASIDFHSNYTWDKRAALIMTALRKLSCKPQDC